MTTISKIAFFWLIIAIGYSFHSSYHISGIMFGEEIKLVNATGKTPVSMHLIRIVLEIFTMLLAVLTVQLKGKLFAKFSLVWAILLGLANVAHLIETSLHELTDYSQLALLSFILLVNVSLILNTKKRVQES